MKKTTTKKVFHLFQQRLRQDLIFFTWGASTGALNQFKIIVHLLLLWKLPLEVAKENTFTMGLGKH